MWLKKGAKATGMITTLVGLSVKASSRAWRSFTRLELVHRERPRADVSKKRATSAALLV